MNAERIQNENAERKRKKKHNENIMKTSWIHNEYRMVTILIQNEDKRKQNEHEMKT